MFDNNNNNNVIEQQIEKLNKNYAVIKIGKDSFVLDETRTPIEFLTVKGFQNFFSNHNVEMWEERADGSMKKKLISVADSWLKHKNRRTYNGLVFDPSGNARDGYYNLWKGFTVEPAKGDVSLYWNMVRDIICNGDEATYRYVRKWMAHAVQHPDQLPRTALVLRGLKGTGKGIFANTFGSLFGDSYGAYSSLDRIIGRFTGQMKNKVVVLADEAVWGGNKKEEGALKALITEPSRAVEMKGKETFLVDNFVRLIIASNEDWAAPTSADERRFVYCNVNPERAKDLTYYGPIAELMKTEAARSALLWDLNNEDLAGFEPLDLPEENYKGGLDMAIYSMSSERAFIYDWLNDGEALNHVTSGGGLNIMSSVLHEKYVQWCRDSSVPHILSNVSFGIKVKKLLPIEKVHTEMGTTYNLPNLEQCRNHFSKTLGGKLDWNVIEGKKVRKPLSVVV